MCLVRTGKKGISVYLKSWPDFLPLPSQVGTSLEIGQGYKESGSRESDDTALAAINKDPEANIFKVAHFGIIGGYKEVLPALTERLKELLAE